MNVKDSATREFQSDRRLKILKVIHGYPMRYNAGSEVYTQTLCHELAKHHEVHVFTREEDPFAPDYQLRIEQDADESRVMLHLVNNPRSRDSYRSVGIDRRFAEVLDRVNPDIVHIGHLSHLSTTLVQEPTVRGIPIVFTLHDYWMMCPRGQFMQTFPEDPTNLWASCSGQDNSKCATRCFARSFSGDPDELDADVAYWAEWIKRRMRHARAMVELIDLFVAPAQYLLRRFEQDFVLPREKLVYLDYGFARDRMNGRVRTPGEPFTFGYIGTHIPAKGVHDLVRAFGMLRGQALLRIWGRPLGQNTEALRAMVASLPDGLRERVEWLPEYRNQDIVRDVFDRVDAIVVPSVWVENSPLVIHEAQQARIPVITANAGGMAEYVHHEVNGLLFEHRSTPSLARAMQRFVDAPALAQRLGARGYLYRDDGQVPAIEEHGRQLVTLYEQVMARRDATYLPRRDGPWRITFDTNPDACNLRCVMCEENSPFRSKERPAPLHRRLMPFELLERVVGEAVARGMREVINHAQRAWP